MLIAGGRGRSGRITVDSFERVPFFRGVSEKYQTDRPSVLSPRRDRRPRNSSYGFHGVADNWFDKRFGIAYRSQGLFLTPNVLSASAYAYSLAHVMRVIPIGGYRYCWSPKISDLLFAATRLAEAGAKEVEAYLDSAEYRETDLQEAHDSGHEIMLYCERYIAIPIELLGDLPVSQTPAIILGTAG